MVNEWRGRRLVTAHNLAGRRVTARFGPHDVGGEELVDLLDAAPSLRARRDRFTLTLPAYGHRWFRVRGSE